MKRCPYCGRLNTSSDQVCYSCENPLGYAEGPQELPPEDPLDSHGLPLSEEAGLQGSRVRSSRVLKRREPTLFQLALWGLIRKVFFLFLSLGGFFLMALLAIRLTYDNFTVAMTVVGIFAFCVLLSVFFPDCSLSRRYGKRVMLSSLISNSFLLALAFPLVLLYLQRKGYISNTSFLFLPMAIGAATFLLMGMFLSWWFSRRERA